VQRRGERNKSIREEAASIVQKRKANVPTPANKVRRVLTATKSADPPEDPPEGRRAVVVSVGPSEILVVVVVSVGVDGM